MITIIVLLILAGVSIAMLTGENVILTQAQNAKDRTNEAAKNEQLDLARQEDFINETLNGVEVEQVTDSNPGVLEQEDANTYIINSIEDLVVFAYDVTNGNNYEGETVKLGTSLDFNSTKSYVEPFRTDYGQYGYGGELKILLTSGEGFQTIGITTEDNREKSFAGIFDGNGNCINNLYINIEDTTDMEFRKIGMFGLNFGVIKNIYLNNVDINLQANYPHVAGIAAQNTSSGTISNCGVTGSINMLGRMDGLVGGITTYNGGTIEKSFNEANIVGEFGGELSLKDSMGAGGISASTGGNIEQCYNKGKITITNNYEKENKIISVGGITGDVYNRDGIKECYNIGNIIIDTISNINIGGISGKNTTKISNCYNLGQIEHTGETVKAKIGMLVGNNNGAVSNSYYKENSNYVGIGTGNQVNDATSENDIIKTESDMKNDNFVTILNAGNNVWKKDTSNINNGYPILDWQ